MVKKTKETGKTGITDEEFKKIIDLNMCLGNGTKSIRQIFVIAVMLLCSLILDAKIVIICFLASSVLIFLYYLIRYVLILKWFQKLTG
jgi:hypothetical protein